MATGNTKRIEELLRKVDDLVRRECLKLPLNETGHAADMWFFLLGELAQATHTIQDIMEHENHEAREVK